MPRRWLGRCVAAAVLTGALLAPAFALPDAKDGWYELRSPNFVVFTNADPEKAAKQVVEFERFRVLLQSITSGMRLDGELPLHIYIFRSEASMGPYKDASDAAYHVATPHGYYIAINLRPATTAVVRDNPAILFPYGTLYHEYVHFALRNSFANVPTWIHEGLAEYYSTFTSSAKTALVGRPIELYVKNLDRDGLMPFRDLMNFGSDPHLEVFLSTFYWQSWATVHYLLHGREERREQFFEYFRLVTIGTPPDEAFSKAFGIGYEVLQTEVRGYVHSRSVGYAETPAVAVDLAGGVASTPISHAQACFRLGMLLLASQTDPEDAEEHFRAALAADPPLAQAHYGLGLLELSRANAPAAVAELEKYVAAEPGNAVGHEALGRALLLGASPSLTRAEQSFERALAIEPRLTSAVLGQARARLLETAYRPGLERAIDQAWMQHPTNAALPVTRTLMAFRESDERSAERTLKHAVKTCPRPLLDSLESEIVAIVKSASWNPPPHAYALDQVLRMVQSFRSGSAGPEIQSPLSAADEGITRQVRLLEAALRYFEALRSVDAGQCDAALGTVRSLSDAGTPFKESVQALLANSPCD